MMSFDEMVLPKGVSLASVIQKNKDEIAAIGASNAPFSFVRIHGKRFIAADPSVRAAWERRRSQAAKDSSSVED